MIFDNLDLSLEFQVSQEQALIDCSPRIPNAETPGPTYNPGRSSQGFFRVNANCRLVIHKRINNKILSEQQLCTRWEVPTKVRGLLTSTNAVRPNHRVCMCHVHLVGVAAIKTCANCADGLKSVAERATQSDLQNLSHQQQHHFGVSELS